MQNFKWILTVVACLWAFPAAAWTHGSLPCSSLVFSGAVGNGVADDTVALNTYLATFTTGGCVEVPVGKQYLINSADLSVPTNVIINGASSPWGVAYNGDPYALASGFILNPNYTIVMAAGAQLLNLSVLRAGLIPNPSIAQSNTAVALWGTERSVGITLPANLGSQVVQDVFVMGFNTCIKSSVGAFNLERIAGDCYNGIEVTTAGDNHFIDNVRFEPYYSLHISSDKTTWERPGIAFNFHDGNTGTVATRLFSFMYANAVLLSKTGVTQIADSLFEWQIFPGSTLVGTKGVRWIYTNGETSVDNSVSNGFEVAFSVEGTGEVIIKGVTAQSNSVAGFALGGSTATPRAITITGAVSAGSTASAIVTSASVTGSPLTVTYTAIAGDTLTTVGRGLAQAIHHNQALIQAGVYAEALTAGVVTVYWPSTVTATITAGGSLTTAVANGVALGGTYGEVIGANVNTSITPTAFAVGNSVMWWNIASPYMHNGNLTTDWMTVGDATSEGHLRLSGIPWSTVSGSNLSACGTTPTFTFPSHDDRGRIVEGSGATGCVLTFTTPFPVLPKCIVSSPTGDAITSYVATKTTLTIVNAAPGTFTYTCEP